LRGAIVVAASFILKEDDGYILQETGSKIVLE
jgi:hypothetical protein